MPFIEQILYGHDHLAESGGRQELAHSAGMGAEASKEIHGLIEAWGQAPALGLQHPVLMSHPLRSTMPSIRGRLYAVIRATAGDNPLFHAVVMSDSVYAALGRNPYAAAGLVAFRDEWNGQRGLERLEIDPENRPPLVDPGPGRGDVGLIDEAVLAYLEDGRLQLPLEQGLRDSERALALIIACLPEKDRKELRFASFTTVQGNNYGIAAVETEGAAFAGWRRLMMARLDTVATPQQKEYKEHLAGGLAQGDLNAIMRVSTRHNFSAPAPFKQEVATRNRAAVEPTPPPRKVTPPRNQPVAATIGSGSPAARRTPFQAATRGGGNYGGRREMIPAHGLDPAADVARPRRHSPFRPRVTPAFPGGRPGSGARFIRMVVILLLIFCAGWVGTMWMDGRTLKESVEWAGLPGMNGRAEADDHSGMLLDVVDVGGVYTAALKHTGGGGLGLAASGDKGRQMALGELQKNATSELLAQAELFGELAGTGIHPTERPKREDQRLRMLARQGESLLGELDRLELAWYSLATGTNWRDLPRMTDKAVAARRDSLQKAEKGALADARLGLGIGDLRSDLQGAQSQVAGMSDLVALFQAPRWSRSWEKELAAAAEQVSPSAGATTRAYRNGAFALLRLKRAEREPASRAVPFSTLFEAKSWPSSEVQEILPLLRKETGRFVDCPAPPLLVGTVGLYAALDDPERTIDRISGSASAWQQLQDNAAVRFDPELYLDFLDRLRFEAALRRTRPHGDIERIPAHLCGDADRAAVVAFADSLAVLNRAGQWEAMAAGTEDPFFRRWASHLANDIDARLARRRSEFRDAWTDCRAAVASLEADVKAGYDWSAKWRSLHESATTAIEHFGTDLADDPIEQPRLAYLRQLVASLEAVRPLRVERATVRLDQDHSTDPIEVRLVLRDPLDGTTRLSDPFRIGPSAPEGTGWVGTVALDWDWFLSPRQLLTGQVISSDGRILLEVTCPSLAQEGGPAVMVRPLEGEGGSLTFRLELEEYWGGLIVPDLGTVF